MTKAYFADLRAKRKALGLCLSCGKHPAPCEACRARNREYMRRKRAGLPPAEKTRQWHSQRHYSLKYKFGITEQQYDEMLEKQGNACAICKSTESGDRRTKRLAVDHCHTNGHIRGLLCAACNKGLGLMRDSPELLREAIKYLQRNTPTAFN